MARILQKVTTAPEIACSTQAENSGTARRKNTPVIIQWCFSYHSPVPPCHSNDYLAKLISAILKLKNSQCQDRLVEARIKHRIFRWKSTIRLVRIFILYIHLCPLSFHIYLCMSKLNLAGQATLTLSLSYVSFLFSLISFLFFAPL